VPTCDLPSVSLVQADEVRVVLDGVRDRCRLTDVQFVGDLGVQVGPVDWNDGQRARVAQRSEPGNVLVTGREFVPDLFRNVDRLELLVDEVESVD